MKNLALLALSLFILAMISACHAGICNIAPENRYFDLIEIRGTAVDAENHAVSVKTYNAKFNKHTDFKEDFFYIKQENLCKNDNGLKDPKEAYVPKAAENGGFSIFGRLYDEDALKIYVCYSEDYSAALDDEFNLVRRKCGYYPVDLSKGKSEPCSRDGSDLYEVQPLCTNLGCDAMMTKCKNKIVIDDLVIDLSKIEPEQ